MASVSPVETAAEPTVWRSVCGLTPGSFANLIALTQWRLVP